MASTQKAVASLARVSTATVSRVINLQGNVSQKTRSHVLAAIARSGYVPNVHAKRLRTNRSHAVLVVVPDIADPFCTKIVQGIEGAAHRMGYSVLLGDSQGKITHARAYIDMVHAKQVDGIIYFNIRPPFPLSRRDSAKLPQLPIVNVCDYNLSTRIPSVGIDNVGASAKATRYLLELGHRRIGVIAGAREHQETIDRLKGFDLAFKEEGLSNHFMHVAHGNFDFDSGFTACEALLRARPRPTAIFAHNDLMALGAVQALSKAGLHVPADISVIGFDDIDAARYGVPPLTTIAQPMNELGVTAMQMLNDLLEKSAPSQRRRILPYSLIIRESTAPPRSQSDAA